MSPRYSTRLLTNPISFRAATISHDDLGCHFAPEATHCSSTPTPRRRTVLAADTAGSLSVRMGPTRVLAGTAPCEGHMAHPSSATFVNGPYEVRGTLPSSSDKPKDRGGLLRISRRKRWFRRHSYDRLPRLTVPAVLAVTQHLPSGSNRFGAHLVRVCKIKADFIDDRFAVENVKKVPRHMARLPCCGGSALSLCHELANKVRVR